MMFYEGPILIVLSASLVANIFLVGFLMRWHRKAEFWKAQYDDYTARITPPKIMPDPYEEVVKIYNTHDYNWKEDWD